jgi:catechol 2,3-dioxygenase-like lactoylglutathione lyase family enzyme
MFRDPQINYYVRDVEASARFYVDLFGFEEIFRTPPGPATPSAPMPSPSVSAKGRNAHGSGVEVHHFSDNRALLSVIFDE